MVLTSKKAYAVGMGLFLAGSFRAHPYVYRALKGYTEEDEIQKKQKKRKKNLKNVKKS